MKIIDFIESLSALFIGMLFFVIFFVSLKGDPPKESDVEPKTTYSEPKTTYSEPKPAYSEPKPAYSEPKQKFTSSKKRKNRYGIQAAAKIRSF